MRRQATFDPVEQACDVALLIPSWSALADWKDRTHLYVHQRPLAAEPGSRVWLCKDRRFIWTYRIDDFLELREHLPGHTGDEGEGWALVVSDGRRAARDVDNIPDPHGVATRWMQGFRYLEPGAKAFVKAPRRPRGSAPTAPPPGDALHAPAEATALPAVSWASRVARRLGRRS
jgi:hypothetical protein